MRTKPKKGKCECPMPEPCRCNACKSQICVCGKPIPAKKEKGIKELPGTYEQATYPEEKMWNKIHEIITRLNELTKGRE